MRARSEDVMWREVDGQAIILDLRSSCYLRTNDTGARLWGQLQEDREIGELTSILVSESGIDELQARQDIEQFITELRENGLLVD